MIDNNPPKKSAPEQFREWYAKHEYIIAQAEKKDAMLMAYIGGCGDTIDQAIAILRKEV